MKILISIQYFFPPVGGAEHSLMSLAGDLAKNHEVYVIQSSFENNLHVVEGIKVISCKIPLHRRLVWYDNLRSHRLFYHSSPVILQARYWEKILETEIKKICPDLILTQLNFAPPTIDVATKYGIPSVFFVRSCDQFCPIGFINGTDCDKQCQNCIALQNKMRFLHVKKWLNWNYKSIENSNLVVANSHFIANLTSKLCNVNPIILYPSVNLTKYNCQIDQKEYITFVNPTKGKGLNIFLKIAELMPDKRFIAVGRSVRAIDKRTIKGLNNVNFLEWTDSIEEIYSKTRILLSPAIWPEAFGRTIIEAGINGIPSIGSNCGGIPEAIGNGGIVIYDLYNVDKWIDAIYSLDDELLYNELSKNAKINAEKFNFESSCIEFKKEVVKHIGIYL